MITLIKEQTQEEKNKKIFINALNSYYKLKMKYENNKTNEIKRIINLNNLSWREKRSIYKKWVPKCINCGRVGGTHFTSRYDEVSFSRIIKAVCGNVEPCPLDIVIYLGNIIPIEKLLEFKSDSQDLENIEQIKKKIIINKNDNIFGYLTTEQVLKSFENLKENLDYNIQVYDNILNDKMFIETKNKDKIIALEKEIISNINTIKLYMDNYNKENNQQYVNDAVELFINSLNGKLTKYQNLKYEVNYVKKDNNNNNYYLIQMPFTIETRETNMIGQIKVEKFQVGVGKNIKKKTTKTLKKTIPPLQEAKTRKKKPKLLDISELDDSSSLEMQEEKKDDTSIV
jgi:hypothetical protein